VTIVLMNVKASGAARVSSKLVQASKFLSFVLRHQPEAIDLALDAEGWAA
jgi:RNA:NAD 2'-phosphotransferase (TPT1/KptA family)